ncbi:hypothetical protein FRB98_002352 [Tulasnella sp. 332]|nr:hypothetical protein FRB98_002352 [Tulasnella sp. 332]
MPHQQNSPNSVLKSMIGEITDETNQARAYPLESVTWAIGCVLGPLIGGNLSHPTERYPSLFGNPYFLPCAVSSSITLCSILIAIFFLEETLASKVLAWKDKLAGKDGIVERYSATTETSADEEPAYTAAKLLADPRIGTLMGVSFLFAFLHISWETVFVLFAYTPASLGGLQRTPAEIAFLLSTMGVLGMFLSLVAFPALQHRFDTLPVYKASFWLAGLLAEKAV